MAYLVDKTSLYSIKAEMLKSLYFGDEAKLGLFKLGSNGGFISQIAGGVLANWWPEKPPKTYTGAIPRIFNVLIVTPVTPAICDATVALQVVNSQTSMVFEKIGETPWTGDTPAVWIFECNYSKQQPVDL
jgi:hypothetical protein